MVLTHKVFDNKRPFFTVNIYEKGVSDVIKYKHLFLYFRFSHGLYDRPSAHGTN